MAVMTWETQMFCPSPGAQTANCPSDALSTVMGDKPGEPPHVVSTQQVSGGVACWPMRQGFRTPAKLTLVLLSYKIICAEHGVHSKHQ